MKKCNGTGLVLKICETKNNVWKKYRLSIQNSIDNHIKITYIKPNFASLNKKVNPYKACIYGLCRDFLDGVGYDLGTKILTIWRTMLSGSLFTVLWIQLNL